jgi:hypothetical protein
LDAGGNINVTATTTLAARPKAKANGGGAINVAVADAEAFLFYETTTRIGNNATITANNETRIQALSNVDALTSAIADAHGLGSGGDADARTRSGKPMNPDIPVIDRASNIVDVNNNAQISGATVFLVAELPNIRAEALANSDVTAAVDTNSADSFLEFFDFTHVIVRGGAQITGVRDLELAARAPQLGTTSIANADSSSLIDSTTADSHNDTDVQAVIIVEPGTILTSAKLVVDTTVDRQHFVNRADADGGVISLAGLFEDNDEEHGELRVDAQVTYHAETLSLHAGPRLEIRPDLTTVVASTFDLAFGDNTITVTGWDTDSPSVRFLTPKLSGNASFEFTPTLGYATIINRSSRDLVLGTLGTLSEHPPAIDISAADASGFSFTATRSVRPTLLEIEQVGGGDIIIDGLIDNPLGETRLINHTGNIYTRGTFGQVRTHVLELTAVDGSIGVPGSDDLFRAKLVRYDETPERLAIASRLDARLQLEQELIDLGGVNGAVSGAVHGGTIRAGRNIELALLPVVATQVLLVDNEPANILRTGANPGVVPTMPAGAPVERPPDQEEEVLP